MWTSSAIDTQRTTMDLEPTLLGSIEDITGKIV